MRAVRRLGGDENASECVCVCVRERNNEGEQKRKGVREFSLVSAMTRALFQC